MTWAPTIKKTKTKNSSTTDHQGYDNIDCNQIQTMHWANSTVMSRFTNHWYVSKQCCTWIRGGKNKKKNKLSPVIKTMAWLAKRVKSFTSIASLIGHRFQQRFESSLQSIQSISQHRQNIFGVWMNYWIWMKYFIGLNNESMINLENVDLSLFDITMLTSGIDCQWDREVEGCLGQIWALILAECWHQEDHYKTNLSTL